MTTDDLQPFDVVEATFKPRRTDDLKPEVIPWVGHRGLWQAMWVIPPDENPQYAGQLALQAWWIPGSGAPHPLPLGGHWAPSGDFEIHRFVPRQERSKP